MIPQSLLDEWWDFGDAVGSEERFARAARDENHTAAERAELLTQQARALGLQERYIEGDALLGRLVDIADPVVMTRIALERGRLRNSAGEPESATADFETALGLARSAGHEFLEIDALHMLAIADRARGGQWALRGVERAEQSTDPRTRRWLVSLWNNVGWSRFDAGRLDTALEAFREAARRAGEVGTDQQRQWAAEAVAECEAAIAAASNT